jgi:hypothetical protein
MRKAVLVLFCFCLVFAISARRASAVKEFFDEFKAKYTKDNAELAKLVDTTKCNVCHQGTSKKVRNDYGKALDTMLEKTDKMNKDKIQKALDSVYAEKVPGKEETFGDRIKAGKLPGGN